MRSPLVMVMVALGFCAVGSNGQMTPSFPVGSCRMSSLPSLPYSFSVLSTTATKVCLQISLTRNHTALCAKHKVSAQCKDMVSNLRKVVFWYRNVPECGSSMVKAMKSLQVRPWRVNNLNVGRYDFFPPNSSRASAAGDLAIMKWNNAGEVTLAKGSTFKRPGDASMDGYRLCLTFNPRAASVPFCIADKFAIRYSFYDPKKSLCTVGNARIL
jgi:Pherophorin